MSTVQLSIIIPAFNYAHTLARAVISVANQLNDKTELIVINDGSTDNTRDILNQLKNRFNNNLTIYSKENSGLAHTRNYGINKAIGQYLVFLDADDEMCEGAIEAIHQHLLNNAAAMTIGGHCSVFSNGKRKLHMPAILPEQPLKRLAGYLIDKTISISNGACVMRKDIFDHVKYPEHFRNSEDIPVFAYVLSQLSCNTLQFPLANIYKHDDSLRHNVIFADVVGLQLVDEVFSPLRIPLPMQILKNQFLVHRLLSLSRVCHENKRHLQCTQLYMKAFKTDWRAILKWSYSKKFIRSLIKISTA